MSLPRRRRAPRGRRPGSQAIRRQRGLPRPERPGAAGGDVRQRRCSAGRSRRSTTACPTTTCAGCWPAPRPRSPSSTTTCCRASQGVAGVAAAWPAAPSRRPADDPAAPPSRAAGADRTSRVLLFTSGTTGEPKAAVLRHRHLTSYVISTVEFMGADEDEAALVSVPPYHIAGIVGGPDRDLRRPPHRLPAGLRRPRPGCDAAASESDHPRHGRADDARPHPRRRSRRAASGLPALRHLSYGGGRMPRAGDRAGAGAAAARRLRQRLRPDRDQLDDRRARPRRPPRGLRQRRPDGARAGSARSAGRCRRSSWRSATPTATRCPPASRARSGCAASRCRASTSAADGASTTTAGSRPTTAAGSTTTATSSSRAGSTT